MIKVLQIPFIIVYKLVTTIFFFSFMMSFRRLIVIAIIFLFFWTVHISWFFFESSELPGSTEVLSIIGLIIPFLGAFNGIYQGFVSPLLFLYAIPIFVVLMPLMYAFTMVSGYLNLFIEGLENVD